MFVEEEHSIFMEMSERLYCFLLFIFIVLVWDIFESLSMVSFAVTSKAIKLLVQPENGDLLLHPKDRNLLKRNNVRFINFQLKIRHFKFWIYFYLFYVNFPKPLIKLYTVSSLYIKRQNSHTVTII